MKSNHYACIVTGHEKYIPPSLLKPKLSKFDSIEEFRKYYVCKEAAKLLREGCSIDEAREALNVTDILPVIDPHILTRLNLMRKKKGIRGKEAEDEAERQRYLTSTEFKDKMERVRRERASQTFSEWVEENTGVGKRNGGTCIRPDIFLSWNDRACDGCQCLEYCVCDNKRLSHEKRKPKRR